ncbi:MAG TPA: protein phosphatase 2C domain-containing protein [Streptosporangiaceae bacterium]|nr:protein phosphatase 2C domain-containing protein [Streptosporangiaceae bacterium]
MTDHEATTGAGRPAGDSRPVGDSAAGGAARAPGGRWQVSIGSARGAAHLATGQPNQDAAAHQDVVGPGDPVIVAIADGHGHSRHFRSGSGSLLAVDVACQVAAALTAGLARRAQPAALSYAEVDAAVRGELAPALVRDWRAAVAGHLAEHPFTPEEQSRLDALGDDPEIPYGATLLVVTIVAHWLICAQIGDGDMLAIRPDGQSFGPVSAGEKLDGERTRSLCQPDALAAFRVGVHDLVTRPLVALLLATDGYGNSQTADPWQPGVGRDLARFAAGHDHGWFERQVPGWAQRCASADGSGDDTTIALLVHPDPAAAAVAARQVPVSAAADQATAETLPAGLQRGAGPPGAAQVATVEIDLAGPAAHADTLRIDAVPGDRASAGPVPAGPASADPAATVERTLPIRKSPPSGGRGARPSASPAPPPSRRAGSPAGPPGPSRAQVTGSGSRGPAGSHGPGSRGPAGPGLRHPAGITSSRRTAVMIAAAIALAVLAAVVVVLLALRPAARPAPAPARHVQRASQSSSASGPQQGQAGQGHKAGRSAGHQHEGDG